jgi:hypothetical protein
MIQIVIDGSLRLMWMSHFSKPKLNNKAIAAIVMAIVVIQPNM